MLSSSENIVFVKKPKKSESSEDESWIDTKSNSVAELQADKAEQNGIETVDITLEFEEQSRNAQENDEEPVEEESIEEEMERIKDSERFGDVLVTAYCEEMFPSQEIVKNNGGVEHWKRNANLLLSLAFKISEHSPAFHYLRLCVDFSGIVLTPNVSSTLLSLHSLNDIGVSLRPGYLDHEESFETVTDQIIKPLEEELKDHKDGQEGLQKFSALFYGRCIDTNFDICAVCPIIEHVLSLERPELVMMMKPVVFRLLMVEEMQSPGVFMDIITNPSTRDNCPILENIHAVFKDRFSKGLIHHDSYPAVMICDLIQFLLNFDEHFTIDDIGSSYCKVLMLAKSASALITQEDAGCGLDVLSAATFLRGFFTMLAKFVAGNPSAVKEGSLYVHVMSEVNSLLRDPKSSLQVFFMKQLHKNTSLFDLRVWFGENNFAFPIQGLWRNEKSHEKAVFTSVLGYSEYEEVKAACWKLQLNDDTLMKEFLEKCNRSPNHGFALLGFSINMVYLKRAVRELTDKEEQLVKWIAANTSSFPSLFQQLLLSVLGRRDFNCPQLQLSSESPVKDVELALLVLHIACVVATGALQETVPIYRYFTNPVEFKQPCVLAHSENEIRSVHEYIPSPSVKASDCVTCTCGSRLAFERGSNEKLCPNCHEILNDKQNCSTSWKKSATSSLSTDNDTCHEWYLCPKHMSPAVYRALHFIVYSSYYTGIALGISSEEKVAKALNVLRGFEPDNESTTTASFCFQSMETDLSFLMKILSCHRNVAIKSMHLVVERASDLLRSNNLLGISDCSSPKARREWETMFAQLTETVFLNGRETSKKIKEMMKLQHSEESQETVTLECRILELDKYPEDPEEQNQQLKRLFRMTRESSLEDFRSTFLNSPKHVKVKYGFLTMFFAKFDQISTIGNLHHLLKWSRLVSSALTHRISRKGAQSKFTINDFITGHLLQLQRNPDETKRLRELFNKFKEAWNKMLFLVKKELGDKQNEMPRLGETDSIAYCLTESDYGIYLQTAIEILVSHQNSILDIIISLSLHRHPALTFQEKENCSGVASISIQKVSRQQVINFEWCDDIFQDARNNPEYGKGQEITYDFERIEMELATEIAFGKCYLTGGLNKFIFAKELFHSCGPLLTEIRSQVTQSPKLPEDVRKGVSNLKERRIKEAQDLLQHIEVLIFLLKRKLKKFNEDMTLEELAEKWSPMLPSPFPVNLLPQPRSSIKIKHVAALYEALEDVLADGAIEGLAEKFREELSDEMKEPISAMVDRGVEQFKPQNFLNAVRRFVFRYLSPETERYWPEESTSLQSCLKEPSLWSPLQPPNLADIPQEITLEYIYSIVKYLEELEKVKCTFL